MSLKFTNLKLYSNPPGANELTSNKFYLQQVWFQLLIHHDVKAENFEAGTTLDMVREASPVVMPQDGMSRDQGLDDKVVYVSP